MYCVCWFSSLQLSLCLYFSAIHHISQVRSPLPPLFLFILSYSTRLSTPTLQLSKQHRLPKIYPFINKYTLTHLRRTNKAHSQCVTNCDSTHVSFDAPTANHNAERAAHPTSAQQQGSHSESLFSQAAFERQTQKASSPAIFLPHSHCTVLHLT